MSEPFLGEIIIFAGSFAIRDHAFCDGQLLPISQNTALFALLGTTYGGDGRTSFGLPDLQGRVPVMWGQGPGLSSYQIGQKVGTETVALSSANLAPHTHQGRVAEEDASTTDPTGSALGIADESVYLDSGSMGTTMDEQVVGSAGASPAQPHENRQPYLSLSYLIALQGIFPSRS